MPEFLTTDELAEMCRTSPNTVRYWRHIGYGPKSFRLGRRALYSADEVRAWIEETRAEQAQGGAA